MITAENYRTVHICGSGELRLGQKRGRQVICPVRPDSICTSRCAWFSIDEENGLVRCQTTIIGKSEKTPELFPSILP